MAVLGNLTLYRLTTAACPGVHPVWQSTSTGVPRLSQPPTLPQWNQLQFAVQYNSIVKPYLLADQ